MKLVYGVGINDAGYAVCPTTNGKQVWCKFYDVWTGMLERCYSHKYQERKPSYRGCTVCDEWLTFSKFREWMIGQDWDGNQLDKDLLVKGNKIYSPSTCLFVSRQVNMFITSEKTKNSDLPIGVSLYKHTGEFQTSVRNLGRGTISLGRYKTPEEAHLVWLEAKQKLALELSKVQTNPIIAKAVTEYFKEQ